MTNNCTQLKDPTTAMIMADYMLQECVDIARANTIKATTCLELAVEQQRALGESILDSEIMEHRRLMAEFLASISKVDKARMITARLLKKKGYRKITTADFAVHGARSKPD